MAKKTILIFLALFLFSFNTVGAQVVINEVLNNPAGSESGAEWVELYNKSSSPVSLSGCVLFLDVSADQKVQFGENDFVDKYKVISWD